MRRLIILLIASLATWAACQAAFIVTASGGRGVVQADDALASAWPGIPDPESAMTYDALAMAEPADHANWPAAEIAGHYYVCPDGVGGTSTDTTNTYGYPNKPRETVPTTITFAAGGGAKLVLATTCASFAGWAGTDGLNITLATDGVSGSPNWVVGRCSVACTAMTRPELANIRFDIQVDYVVLSDFDNLLYDEDTGTRNDTPPYTIGGDFITIRHQELSGPGLAVGNGSNFGGLSGASTSSQLVIYDFLCHDFGDWDTGPENDFHCFDTGVTNDVNNIWLLEFSSYHLGGDGIQIGDAGATHGSGVHHIYIGGGTHYENGENAVDIKIADDVIISRVIGHDFLNLVGSAAGEVFSVHNAARRVWLIQNTAYDSLRALVVSSDAGSTQNGFVIGNLFYGHGTNGMELRASTGTPWRIVNNTFYDNPNHIQQQDPAGIVGNIFGQRSDPDAGLDIEAGGESATSEYDYNLFEDRTVDFSTALLLHSVLGDADFTNAAADDFTLQVGSPAINAGTKDEAFATFLSLYGFELDLDIDGTPYPATDGDRDIGAYERP